MGVLRINANYVAGEDEFSDRLVDKFPKLWDGIGCLRGQQLQLHIDPSVPPIATKYNRVPFHRREKVEKEIQKLVVADIIERVIDGPTEWVSRIVTPLKPKKTDEIRLCMDMRDANKAILQTRHVSSTLDELVTELNGATMFSKIDLRSGYHQLVLHPSCRYITTFATHVGSYRLESTPLLKYSNTPFSR